MAKLTEFEIETAICRYFKLLLPELNSILCIMSARRKIQGFMEKNIYVQLYPHKPNAVIFRKVSTV